MFHVTADGIETLRTTVWRKVEAEIDKLLRRRPRPEDIRVWWPRDTRKPSATRASRMIR